MRSCLALVLALAGAWAGCSSGEETTPAAAGDSNDAPPPGTPPGEDDEEPTGIPDPPEPPEDASAPPPSAALVPGCTAKATIAGHTAWMFFTRPDKPCRGKAGSGLDTHALDELTRLIDSVPAGGRIDGHIFSISVDGVARALLNAQTRGVDVWISADGNAASSTDPSKTAYLDELVHKVYCTANDRSGCVASAGGSISHTKLFTFSSATAPDGTKASNVVWFGSANQTYASGMRLYNNTVTIYGDAGLFGDLRSYLDDLYERRTQTDYYDPGSGRGHLLQASADVYVSPEIQTDLVVNRLDDITPDPKCEVRVMQASIRNSRLAVVDRLVAMKQGGCTVLVVAHTVEPSALSALTSAGIKVKKALIHDKAFVIRATYGAAYAYRVYTGSHNLSGSAAHKYDEIFVKLAPETAAAHPVYDAFLAHFDDAYGTATPLN